MMPKSRLNRRTRGKWDGLTKKKIQALIDQQRTYLAEVEYLDLDDVAKVMTMKWARPCLTRGLDPVLQLQSLRRSRQLPARAQTAKS